MSVQDSDDADGAVDPGSPRAREIALRRAEEIANEGQIVSGDAAPREFYGPVNYFASYTGPTPPASEIRGLYELDPKYADRVFEMAERDQLHRHRMDDLDSDRSFRLARGGQRAGLIVALAGFVVAVVLAFLHQPEVAAVIGALDIVSLVVVFVTGRVPVRRPKAKEQADRPTELTDD